jgi:hypothetical protein
MLSLYIHLYMLLNLVNPQILPALELSEIQSRPTPGHSVEFYFQRPRESGNLHGPAPVADGGGVVAIATSSRKF